MLLHSLQFWTVAIGALVPLVTYPINHAGPWLSEPAKLAAHIVIAAVAAGIYQAAVSGGVGFNTQTAQDVLFAVSAALAAHHLAWKPSGIAARLGAGTNSPQQPIVQPTGDAAP